MSLGAFTQRIDAAAGRASNVVGFALSGGGAFRGALTVDASFAVASPKRCAHFHAALCLVSRSDGLSRPRYCDSVAIEYDSSRLEPRQLQAIFEATLPLLLEVFNPQGWCVFTAAYGLGCAPLSGAFGSEAARPAAAS